MIYVDIEIGKRIHEAASLGEDVSPARRSLRFASDRTGLASLCHALEGLGAPMQVALEPSGHYWLTLHHAVGAAGYQVVALNPLQTDAYLRAFIRKTKTDTKDATLIADLLRVGRLHRCYVPEGRVLKLRELFRFRFGLTDEIGDAKRKIILCCTGSSRSTSGSSATTSSRARGSCSLGLPPPSCSSRASTCSRTPTANTRSGRCSAAGSLRACAARSRTGA